MPGGFSRSYYTTNLVSINNAEYTLFKRPHFITDAEVEDWGFSTHGYLVDLPTGSLELVNHDEEGQPAAIKIKFGQGCMLATQQTLECGWDRGNSPMLENYLRYYNYHGDYHLSLSLALNGQP